jgi:gluconokinase
MELPMHKLVVMGVSGCGKSTLGAGVALALGRRLIEGDDFHLPESQAKMRQGIPLQDSDRELWLDRVGQLIAEQQGPGVATCSALKRRYRERLRAHVPGLLFVFADITESDADRRVSARADHLFPASLVASQFEALESPVGEPGVLRVDTALAPQAQVDAVVSWLAARVASPANEVPECMSPENR